MIVTLVGAELQREIDGKTWSVFHVNLESGAEAILLTVKETFEKIVDIYGAGSFVLGGMMPFRYDKIRLLDPTILDSDDEKTYIKFGSWEQL